MQHVNLPICCLRRITAHCDVQTVMNLQQTCRESADLFRLNVQMQGFVAVKILKDMGALYATDWKEFHRTRRRGAHWQLWTHSHVNPIGERLLAEAHEIVAESDEILADSDSE